MLTTFGVAVSNLSRLNAAEQAADAGYRVIEQYQDILANWFGVNEIVVTAQSIFIAGEVRGLIASEGAHQHELNISAEQMQKLKSGQAITVRTETALGHTHDIVIDPAAAMPGGTILQVKIPMV